MSTNKEITEFKGDVVIKEGTDTSIYGNGDLDIEGEFRLKDDAGGEYVGMNAPSSVSTSYTLTFPSAVGTTGQVISLSDGSGTLQFASNGVSDFKASVRVATTASGTLASDFENGDTIDSISLSTGDRILIKNQASGTENGIYTVNASGAPTRTSDFAATSTQASAFIIVEEGTTNADTAWICTNNQGSDVVGTDSLVFTELTGGGGGGAGQIAYDIFPFQALANSTSYGTIARFTWLNSRYSGYTNGVVIFRTVIGNRDLDIRLQDVTNVATLGSSLAIGASTFSSFTVTNPGTDSELELQIRKSASGGTNPIVTGVQLEYDQ